MTASISELIAEYVPGSPVLDRVSLDVGDGEIVTVLGASGSGKTTLLRVIAGLHAPVSGRVSIDGVDVTRLPAERRGVGLVPQEGALFAHLDVAANVAYGLRGVRRRDAAAHPRVRELLELVGLDGYEARMPSELSGGQQQRVALARAMAPQPRLVLLDEPFSALDAGLRMRLRDDVFGILREQGLPAVLITHDQQEALSVSDRVAILRRGRIAQTGTPQELYRAPVDPWVARFVGDATVLPVEWMGPRAMTALGEVDLEWRGSEAGLVLIRPEQVRIVPLEGAPARGTVLRSRYVGASVIADIRIAGLQPVITTRLDSEWDGRPGDTIGLATSGRVHGFSGPGSEAVESIVTERARP